MKKKSFMVPAMAFCLAILLNSPASASFHFFNSVYSNSAGLTIIEGDSLADIQGTYQIQVIGSRDQPYIPANLRQLVLLNRHATEIKFVQLGTVVKLMILPLSEINKPGFKPLDQIAHISNVSEQ